MKQVGERIDPYLTEEGSDQVYICQKVEQYNHIDKAVYSSGDMS